MICDRSAVDAVVSVANRGSPTHGYRLRSLRDRNGKPHEDPSGIGTANRTMIPSRIETADLAMVPSGIGTTNRTMILSGIRTANRTKIPFGIGTAERAMVPSGIGTADRAMAPPHPDDPERSRRIRTTLNALAASGRP